MIQFLWAAINNVIPWQFVGLVKFARNLAFLSVFQSHASDRSATVVAVGHHQVHRHNGHHSSLIHRKPLPRSFPITHPTSERITIANMTCGYLEQPLNHFVPRGQSPTYLQRFCYYNDFLPPNSESEDYPILFYTGNESPLEQYINNTGLMWELAPELHARVVFAEHRYEGQSLPPSNISNCMSYSSSAQALEDFVALLEHINPGSKRPVVAFGGSYGGMLCAWLRMKYPSSIAGAIAASAPIWGLPKAAVTKDYTMDASWNVIARGLSLSYPPTASSSSSPNHCAHNLKAAWPLIYYMGTTFNGRLALQKLFRLCQPLTSLQDAQTVIAWAQGLWFDLAEGSFPYPSSYLPFSIHMGIYNLPAWPVQYACWKSSRLFADLGVTMEGNLSNVTYNITYGDDNLVLHIDWDNVTASSQRMTTTEEDWISSQTIVDLLTNVRDAVSIWYNISKQVSCYNVSSGWSDGSSAEVLAPDNNNNNNNIMPAEVSSWRMVSSTNEAGFAAQQQQQQEQQRGRRQTQQLAQTRNASSSELCHDKVLGEGSWNSLCCNEDINMLPTFGFGLGRDFLWPPSQPRDYKYYPHDAMVWNNETSCADPNGYFGYPSTADPWSTWLDLYYGGVRIGAASNIVFSNGLLDPWSAAGVYAKGMDPNARASANNDGSTHKYNGPMVQNVTKDGSVIALILEHGGHHTDLMYSDPSDPDDIRYARRVERERIQQWIDEWRQG